MCLLSTDIDQILFRLLRQPRLLPLAAFHGFEMGSLFMPFRSWGMFRRLLRLLGRTIAWRFSGKIPFTAGLATTGRLINQLRYELWASALRPESLAGFTSPSASDTKPEKPEPHLASAAFHAIN